MIKTFKINLNQMYLDTKQPKKHQQKFKRFLLTKDDKERIKRDNENIKRIDAQTRFKK